MFCLIQSVMGVVVDEFKFQLWSLIVRYTVSEAFQKKLSSSFALIFSVWKKAIN